MDRETQCESSVAQFTHDLQMGMPQMSISGLMEKHVGHLHAGVLFGHEKE